MPSMGSKVIAVVLVAIVVVAGLGYWVLAPKMPSQTAAYTTQHTSLLTSSEQTSPQPISYYLGLLESSHSEPYVQLAKELRKLPDLTNTTAVAKIAYLALNATNPEVKEAFELMMKGGTPDPRDFAYIVPSWNTELQVLYWLALQNQFKRDDTLALAIAVVNGLWVTMGDDDVRDAVFRDASSMLSYGRETSEWQRGIGLPYNIEDYPFEAKICWAWTGNDPGRGGHYIIDHMYSGKPVDNPTGKSLNIHPLIEHKQTRIDLKAYLWNTVDPGNLPKMKKLIMEKKWFNADASMTAGYIDQGLWNIQIYTSPNDDFIVVDGEKTVNHNMNNADFELEYLTETGHTIGVCDDQATTADAFLKSVGIPSDLMVTTWQASAGAGASHTHIFYFDPERGIWTALKYQFGPGSDSPMWNVYLVRPPENQGEYLSTHKDSVQPYFTKMMDSYVLISRVTPGDVQRRFGVGIGGAQVKQWLLYGENPTAITVTYTTWTPPAAWNVLSDGSLDLISEDGEISGDLGQAYADVANVSYSFYNGSLFFRFSLHGEIPNKITTTHVSSVWYQVFLDVNSDSSTGYHWSNDFTPDYMLEFSVTFDSSSKTAKAESSLLKYSGTGTDWSWTSIRYTQRFGSEVIITGGVGQDFFVLTCEYQDISASKGSTAQFFARSGILYGSKVYNDPIPDEGTVKITL